MQVFLLFPLAFVGAVVNALAVAGTARRLQQDGAQ
eukprot:SAG25_NODE_7753_length_461_cov_3.102210_1_plen_34_part_10